MKTLSDQELAETETLLRRRLAQLADHAPTTVQFPGEVPVITVDPRRRNRRRVGVLAAVTALVGAGGFTTYSFLGASNDGGAATPEEAVTTFVSAAEHEDVLGMIDVTLPEEVGVLRDAVQSATSDATRLDLLSNGFDAGGVKGVDISIDDLALDTNYLEGGLAEVTATGGTLSASIDPQAFPFGSKLRAFFTGSQKLVAASKTLGTTDTPALLMTVQRGGRWYVSVEYTLAEYVRRASGWEMPAAVTRSPVGFDSPEAAVTGFYERLAALDVQAATDTFAPGEDAIAWLSQSWLPDVQAATDRGRADGWSVAISGLTYETIGSGSHLTLSPLTFKIEGSAPAGFNESYGSYADPSVPTLVVAPDGATFALVPAGEQVPATTAELSFTTDSPPASDKFNIASAMPDGTITPLVFAPATSDAPLPFTIEHADGCATYRGEAATGMFGFSNSPQVKHVDGGYQLCGSPLAGGLNLVLPTAWLSDLPAVSVVESGGKWYVSPLGTLLATISASLHDTKDGSSLFDSAWAPFFYGGMTRASLEAVFIGQSTESIDAVCLSALTVDNGEVTGVVADPSPDAVRACLPSAYGGGEVSAQAPTPVMAPIPTPPPAITTP